MIAPLSPCRLPLALLVCTAVLLSQRPAAFADARPDRFSAGGYFRIMTRPSLQGGEGKLGYWWLYGRLLNEGPYGKLELRLDLLQPEPGTGAVWASVHAAIEGDSFRNASLQNGKLSSFGISEFYLRAGNILLADVVWTLGTLDYYFGQLGLYDQRPAQIFYETIGLAAHYRGDSFELLLGVGDSGYFIRGEEYTTILTAGTAIRLHLSQHFELGMGGQAMFEPAVVGNPNAPHRTPLPANATYEDYHRREIVQRFAELNPGLPDLYRFPNPQPVGAFSYKVVAYLGVGKLGPLNWNSLFANYQQRHPENSYIEQFGGRDYRIYIRDFTDERYELNVGNEMNLTLVGDFLDASWGTFFGYALNRDNTVVAGEDNRLFFSTVLRLQCYLSSTFHLLLESSFAEEHSLRGNLWREHYDSIFASSAGVPDSEGLEIGDSARRTTWQLKVGVVLNPTGIGIYARPSIRVIWGLQYSNVHNAFGNNFVDSLDQFEAFRETADRHWHSVVGLEAEGWF